MHLQLFLPLTLSSMITSQRRWAWWKIRMKTSAPSPQTRTWDVFINLAMRASQNTSQVVVHVDDADVFLVFIHHAHHLCEVFMKLTARGRNNSRCTNISQPARKIGPHVSGISIFAVVLFRIDQRLLITTAGTIAILGMLSSCSLPCVHWLWLYDNSQPERRREAFPADHLDAFAHLSETELFQGSVSCKLEQLTRGCCIAARRQESIMPVSKHLYPKCQRKDPKCHNMWRHLIQPPYHHGRLWWINS